MNIYKAIKKVILKEIGDTNLTKLEENKYIKEENNWSEFIDI